MYVSGNVWTPISYIQLLIIMHLDAHCTMIIMKRRAGYGRPEICLFSIEMQDCVYDSEAEREEPNCVDYRTEL